MKMQLKLPIAAFLLASAGLSGCIVDREPTTLTAAPLSGTLTLEWTVDGQAAQSGCATAGLTKVDVLVLDATKSKILGKTSASCAGGRASVITPPASGVWVQVDGYRPNDPAGSPSWGNSPLTGPHTITANKEVQIAAPVNLVKLSSITPPSGSGNAYVTWTVGGEAPAAGCAKRSISAVNVRILDEQRKEIAQLQVPCSAGNATVANIAAGKRFVQLDAVGPSAPEAWGNVNLDGPMVIENGKVTSAAKAIDIAKRSVISLDWAMANGGSCAGNGVGTVYVEVRDANNKLIVPMSDPWAAKPCSLTSADSYDARVIDVGYAQPQCAIPPNAKGLVLCNAPAGGLGVFLTATPASSTFAKLGGSMNITGFEAGSHIAVISPVVLSPCSGANPCVQP